MENPKEKTEMERVYKETRKVGARLAAISFLCDPNGPYGEEKIGYLARIGLGELFFDLAQEVCGISMDYEQIIKDKEGGGDEMSIPSLNL